MPKVIRNEKGEIEVKDDGFLRGDATDSRECAGSVKDDLIKLAARMLMNRGNYPTHPENQDFKMSQRAWDEMCKQHKNGDEFFRQVGIELRALADRLPNSLLDGVERPN